MTFGAGQSTVQVRPLAPDDDVDSAERTFVLWLVSGAGDRLGDPSRATVAVRDNDDAPAVTIADAPTVKEGGTLAFPGAPEPPERRADHGALHPVRHGGRRAPTTPTAAPAP